MKRVFYFAWAAMVLLMVAGCGSGHSEGASAESTPIDSVITLDLQPQSFAVNEIPDAQFGKALKPLVVEAVPSAKPLPELKGSVPEWLDAIISRESIVAFGKVMAQNPDELEFLQKETHLMDAGAGMKAFWTLFTTRPSNSSIVVWGAFASEKEAYWASIHRPGALKFELHAAQKAQVAQSAGVRIEGIMTTETGSSDAFRSEISTLEAGFGVASKR